MNFPIDAWLFLYPAHEKSATNIFSKLIPGDDLDRSRNVFKSVDDYFESQPEDTKRALYEVRDCIREAVPDVIEMFNYGIPAFALVENGKRDQQIMIAGYSNHVGFYPHPETIELFKEELKDYKQGKGSVQLPNSSPIPKDLIKRMVRKRKEIVVAMMKKKRK